MDFGLFIIFCLPLLAGFAGVGMAWISRRPRVRIIGVVLAVAAFAFVYYVAKEAEGAL